MKRIATMVASLLLLRRDSIVATKSLPRSGPLGAIQTAYIIVVTVARMPKNLIQESSFWSARLKEAASSPNSVVGGELSVLSSVFAELALEMRRVVLPWW